MKLKDLRHFQALAEKTGEPSAYEKEWLWEAVATLVRHLDDHLLIVEETTIPEGTACVLTVFTARDANATPLYALANTGGVVIIGRADELPDNKSRQLAGFDPFRDEVVSLVVTRAHRLVGERLDLWLVVRRSDDSATVAYHGLVWLGKDGQPELAPARDDENAGSGEWAPIPASNLPEWMRSRPMTFAPGLDPFVDSPQGLPGSEASAEVLAWAKGTLCYATPEELVLRRGRDEKTMPLRGKVAALAILDPTPDRAVIIVAYANRWTAGFAESEEGVLERWEQLLPGFPLALGPVPDTARTASGSEAWPDVLLAVNAGLLHRRAYVGSKQIRKVWRQCWERLGYHETDGGICAAEEARTRAQASPEEAIQRESTEMPVEQRLDWLHRSGAAAGLAAEDRRGWLHGQVPKKLLTIAPKADRWEAALVWAIEGVLGAAPTAAPDELDRWLVEVSELFSPPAPKRVLTGGVLRLLQALREFAEGRETWPLLGQKGDFLPALVWRVYHRQSQVVDRERIDAVVRALDWLGNPGQDPNVKRLRERSDRNREMVLEGPDPQDPTAVIERASIRIGFWASAYIPSDSLELAEPGSGSRRLLSLAYLKLESGWCLAIAQGRQLGLYELQKYGKLNPTPSYRDRREGDLIQSLARVPAEGGDRLLVVTRSGNAVLLAVNSDGQGFQELARLGGGDCVSASAVAFYPDPPGQGALAMACTEGRRSTLLTARIEVDRFGTPSRFPLKLPRVASLDVSACGAEGFWVISGTGQLAPFYLSRMGWGGQATEPRPLQVLKGGASALCFETDKDPDYVLAGDYGGMLRCLRLTPPAAAGELHWSYQLKGAIRAITRLKHDGKTHFLVGSEQGELCLFRAEDGTRVWKDRTWEPIRRVAVADSPGLAAVGMRHGMIVAFKQLEEQERSASFRGVIERNLIWLKDNFPLEWADPAWNHPDADWLKAIYQIKITERDPASLLKEFEDRETRARIVRYAAQEHRVESTAMVRNIVQALRFRELALLLAYLPEREEGLWLEPVYHALAERRWGAGDDSPRAAIAAYAVFVRRLSRRQPGIDALIRHLPPGQYLEKSPWVRTEYLRALAESVRKEDKGMESLLPVLLSHLLRLPPDLLIKPEAVFRHDSEAERDLNALAELLIRLKGTERPIGEALSRVVKRLDPLSKGKGWLAFLYSLLALCLCYAKNAEKEWRTWRAEALAALRSFAKHSHAYDTADATEAPVVEALRALLLRRPMPEDRDRLEIRREWVENAWRRAEGSKEPAPEVIKRLDASWRPHLAGLFKYTGETVQSVLRAELSHVEQQVRPRLVLQKCTREEGNRVRLWVQTQPEGWGQLDDVTLVFDAQVDPSEGLLPLGDGRGAVISMNRVSYPGPFGAQDLEFSGYVRPKQKTVKIKVSMQAFGPYTLEETWAFDIPPALGPAPTGLSLPESLAWLSQKFFTRIEHIADRCCLGVYDEELGRSRFFDDWDKKHPGQRIDLDGATRDIGPGRAYSALALDLDCIEAPIREALARASDVGRGVPLLVGPVDELFQRLLEGEAPGATGSLGSCSATGSCWCFKWRRGAARC